MASVNETKVIQCNICDKTFTTKGSLKRHEATVHNCFSANSYTSFKCPKPDCILQFSRFIQLTEHLEASHSLNISVEELSFVSEEDFLNWKYDLQRKTLSEYIKQTSSKVLYDGTRKVYLTCSRSNQRLPHVTNRKRALKSQGYKKIEKSCPSRIEAIYNKDLTLSVKFWKTHCGHTNDLGHLQLDKPTKDQIARKLQDGVPFEHILNETRKEGADSPTRTMLLDRKDLHNVVRDYNIAYVTRPHKEDGVSVKTLANKANKILDLLNKAKIEERTGKLIGKKLDSAIRLLYKTPLNECTDSSVKLHSKKDMNVRENIESQVRPFSTKKKIKTSKENIKKPTHSESLSIIEELKSEPQVVANVHTSNDHTYNM